MEPNNKPLPKLSDSVRKLVQDESRKIVGDMLDTKSSAIVDELFSKFMERVNGEELSRDVYERVSANLRYFGGQTAQDPIRADLAAASPGSSLVSFIQSGTGAVSRNLQGKLQDYVNVLDFIPVSEHAAIKTGTSTTDVATYVASAHAAVKGSSVGAAKALYWPGGTYRISNLSISGFFKWVGDGPGTLVKAIAGGSSSYMIASTQYVTAGQTTCDSPFVIEDMWFDGNSLKSYPFVCRAFYPIFSRVNIYGGTSADLLVSSAGSDGTQLTGTMVNGQINDCTIGIDGAATGGYNILVNDPNFKVTDWQINGGFIRAASTYNLEVPNCSGWIVRGVHFYGATNHWQIKRADYAFICSGNYFDGGNVDITNGNAGQPNVVFGPGNTITTGSLLATFGVNGSNIISVSNKYLNGQIQHNLNDTTKTVVSIGDAFNNATPLVKNFSGGVMKSFGSYNASTSAFLQQAISFTPTITFGGASTGITYTTQVGTYSKVEDVVTCWILIILSSKGSATGAAQVAGLPFSINNSSDQNGAACVPGYWALSGLTGVPIFVGQIGTPQISLQQYAAASPTALTDANFSNTSQIQFTFTYRAAQANVVS